MRQKFIYTLWISFFALIGILACSDEPEANFPIEETEPIAEEDELQLILTASETTVYVSSAILFEVAAGEEPVNGADIYILTTLKLPDSSTHLMYQELKL